MSHYNQKLMELETAILKNGGEMKTHIAEIKEKIDSEQLEARKKMEEQYSMMVKSVEQKFDLLSGKLTTVIDEREKEKGESATMQRKLSQIISDRSNIDSQIEERIEKFQKKLFKETDEMK